MYVSIVSVEKNNIVSVKYISTYFNHKYQYKASICIYTKTKTNQNTYNAKLGINN